MAIWFRISWAEVFFFEKNSARECADRSGLSSARALPRRCWPALKISVREPDQARKASSLCEMNDLPRAGRPTITSRSFEESGVSAERKCRRFRTASGSTFFSASSR
jgi:hypothetical protein